MSENIYLILTSLFVIGLFSLWCYVGYLISKGVDKVVTALGVVIVGFFGTQCTLQVIVNIFKAKELL